MIAQSTDIPDRSPCARAGMRFGPSLMGGQTAAVAPPCGDALRMICALRPLGQPALRLPPVCRPQGWAALWRVMGAAISQSERSAVFA